jgi:hypothetical protein
MSISPVIPKIRRGLPQEYKRGNIKSHKDLLMTKRRNYRTRVFNHRDPATLFHCNDTFSLRHYSLPFVYKRWYFPTTNVLLCLLRAAYISYVHV